MTIYCRQTDWKNLLDPTSAHQKLLINRTSFSQVVRLKNICLETSGLNKDLD